MMRNVLRLVALGALAFGAAGAIGTACGPDTGRSFKVTIVSGVTIDSPDMKQKIDGNAELRYTWTRQRDERTLTFDAMHVRTVVNGRPGMDVSMSRAKLITMKGDKANELPFETAPEALKHILRDSFGAPVCKLRVDETGREVRRDVVAGPGAKDLVAQGMIANALLFHPPYPDDRDVWESAAEVSMGNGGFARGELTYRKAPVAGGRRKVTVSGTLANEGFNVAGTPLMVTNARYTVRGEQTFDPTMGEWVAGKLLMDATFRMVAAGNPPAEATATMALTHEMLPAPK